MLNNIIDYFKNKYKINKNYIFTYNDILININLFKNFIYPTKFELTILDNIYINYYNNLDINVLLILYLYKNSHKHILINNKKYNILLILYSNIFIINQRDGRISYKDIKILIKKSFNNNILNKIEYETLFFIRYNYNLTNKAQKYFDNYFY